MNYYIDITLLPDEETNLGFLWQKVYQQIHLAFVENKVGENSSKVSLSIPEYGKAKKGDNGFPLGAKIRLLAAEKSELEQLNINLWLNRFTDYVHTKSIAQVPADISKYACFTRKNVKGENRVLKDLVSKAQHQSKKFGLDYNECLERLQNSKPKAESKLPFIQLTSLSAKQLKPEDNLNFKLFIDMELQEKPIEGYYSCYGLSFRGENRATVPWF